MKFEIKNVKYAAFMSEETNCFRATVYIDGKAAFEVENEGHGGPDNYAPLKNSGLNYADVWKRVEKINAELGKEEITLDVGERLTVKNCLEIVIGHLLNDWLKQKDAKTLLKKVAYYNPDQKGVFTLPAKCKPIPEILAAVKKAKWWKPDFVLLNELPIEKVCSYL